MARYRILHFFLLFWLAVFVENGLGLSLQPQPLTVNGNTIQLMVPEGMRVAFMASLKEPRFLTLGPDNELLIGSRGPDIYRLKQPYTTPEPLVSLTGRNHSIAYRSGNIFIAESGGLYSASYAESETSLQPADFDLITPLPSETGGHWSRTVVVGPDGLLYIGIGISGNCSDEYLDNSYPFERRRGGVFLLDEQPASPVLKPYASGLRNPIGLAFHPDTSVLYATNAGPDNLGFDLPPEVFSILSQGSYHGMPWFQYYNGTFHSGECATSQPPRPAEEATAPAATFTARSTPEGIVFVTDSGLGAEINNNALIAIHGSWAVPEGGDSSSRRAPKIVMVSFSEGKPTGVVSDIVTGFQRTDGSRFARPCGMVMGSDGNLYFTSDGGEVTGLFRLSRTETPALPDTVSPAVNALLLEEPSGQ